MSKSSSNSVISPVVTMRRAVCSTDLMSGQYSWSRHLHLHQEARDTILCRQNSRSKGIDTSNCETSHLQCIKHVLPKKGHSTENVVYAKQLRLNLNTSYWSFKQRNDIISLLYCCVVEIAMRGKGSIQATGSGQCLNYLGRQVPELSSDTNKGDDRTDLSII